MAAPVATLEIQLVADVLRLQAQMKDAQRAIDGMTAGAEAGFNKSGRAASNMARAAQDAAAGLNKTSGAGRMMSQQFSQMAQQVMAGGSAIQAFAIQLPDIVSQLNASGQSANKFAAFLGGPWGIALTSAIALAASFGFEMLKGEESTKKNERAQRSFVDVLKDSKSSWEEVRKAAKLYNDEQAKTRVLALDQIQTEALATAGKLKSAAASRTKYLAQLELAKLEADIAAQTGSGEGLMFALRKQAEVETKIRENVKAISELERTASEITIKTAEAIAALRLDPAAKLRAGFDILRNQARGSISDVNELGNALTDLGRREQAAQKAITDSTRKRADETMKLAKVTGDEIARALGTTVTSGLRSAGRNAGVGGAKNSYHLIGQAIDIPLTINGRPITKEWIRATLEPLGIQIKELLGPGDRGHSDHFHIAFGIKRLAPDQVRKFQEDAVEAAEKAAKAAREAWTREWQALYDMGEDLAKKVLPGLQQIEDASEAAFSRLLAEDNGKRTQWLTDAADASARWNERLEETARLLSTLGDNVFGSSFGNLRGPLSTIASTPFFKIDPNSGKEIATTIGREMSNSLDKVFGGEGSFLKMLQGAATGGSIGALFGTQGSQLGGTIGGAFGEKFGEKFLAGGLDKIAKGLGDFAGPLGSILGGLAGGLLGKLFKSDKFGTATITGIDGFGTSGNSKKNQGPTNSLAQSFQQSLERIASSLDATVGAFQVSLGVTNGKINVNPGQVTGMIGTTKQRDTIDFGEDQAAALKYAIKNAIEDGALQGLSEGWKKFLTESNDIERALSQIGNLKSAYDELASLKDPQGFALQQLDKAFDELRTTATKAGDDLARVEELYGLKRAEIAEKYSKEIASVEDRRALQIQILELEGNTIAALTMARQAEKDAADASLHSLLDRRNALQDEAQAAQEAAAASDRIIALQIRLSRAQGNEATAKALENMQELTGARTDEERAMLMQIHAIDKAMEAQEKLADGFATTADIISRITSETYEMTKSLREFADSIFGREELADPTAQYQELIEKAALGDKAALAKLPDAINAYLGQAQGMSSSLADYQLAAAYARQTAYGVADVADARASYRSIAAGISAKFGGPFSPGGDPNYQMTAADNDALTNAFQEMQRELRELRATVAQGNADRVELGDKQFDVTKQTHRLLDDVTEGGNGMRAAA